MRLKDFIVRFQEGRGRYKKQALIALAFLTLLMFFGSAIKPLLIFAFLILVASFSTFYHNFFRSPVNFELVKLATITSSVAYGALAGILVGVSSDLLGRALSGRFDQDTITSLGAMIAIAVLASMFRTANIAILGILLVVAYYLMILPFLFLFGKDLARASVYIGSNLLFNAILFINVAPLLLNIIGR